MTRNKLFAAAVLLFALIAGTPGWARPRWDRDHDRDDHRARFEHRKRDWRRERAEYRDRDDRRPPGWSKGRKTGWGNCDLPPGLAKKSGDCDRDDFRRHDRDRYAYRRHDRDRRYPVATGARQPWPVRPAPGTTTTTTTTTTNRNETFVDRMKRKTEQQRRAQASRSPLTLPQH